MMLNAWTLGDDTTIKVASKKESKEKTNGIIKLKKPAPKHASPGNWQEGRFIDSRWHPGVIASVSLYPLTTVC